MKDLRLAIRQLLKTPAFSLVAAGTLAVAIAVNATLFSLVYSLAFRPLVPHQPEEVVRVYSAGQGAKRDYRPFSHAEFEALRANRDTFADVAAICTALAGIGEDSAMRRREVFLVSESFFRLMGVAPALGRFFTAEESQPTASARVAVADYAYWQRMGGRPEFIGSTIRVNGEPFTVIGVTPKGFAGVSVLFTTDLWFPLGAYSHVGSMDEHVRIAGTLSDPANFALNLFARLPAGRTLAALEPRLPALAAQLAAVRPPDAQLERELQAGPPWRFGVEESPAHNDLGFAGALFLGMTGIVLVIACVNLANMFLARGVARRHEIAIRLALGAGRWRIVRQWLVEGLVIALAGGALGLLLSAWAGDMIVATFSRLLDRINFATALQLRAEPPVLLATLAVCCLATLLFSLGPALVASRIAIHPHLGRSQGDNRTGGWNRLFAPRHCFVMLQVALSLVLLHGAGLFTRSATTAAGFDLGFATAGGLVAELDYSLDVTVTDPVARRRISGALDEVRAVPELKDAALSTLLVFGNHDVMRRVAPAGAFDAGVDGDRAPPGALALFAAVSDRYFETLGVPLLRGRDFTAAEARDAGASRVAIIDEATASKLFPDRDALGEHIQFAPQPGESAGGMEIVGIVRSHRQDARATLPRPRVFVPFAQGYQGSAFLHARSAATNPLALAGLIPRLRAAIMQVDGNVPLLRIATLEEVVSSSIPVWLLRFGAALSGSFGFIALVLALAGVYGVKAFATAHRTREIGIRMAIGAQRSDVLRLLLGQGLAQIGIGLALGLLLALALGHGLASMLYRIDGFDVVSLIAAAVILSLTATFATWLPAHRATRADPVQALRAE